MGSEQSCPQSPTVQTNYGKVVGKRYISEEKFQADAYLGIPYARPPVGKLQYTKPQPPELWKEVKDCSQFEKRCIQKNWTLLESDEDQPMSLDCLYLNVFCPGRDRLDDSADLPVLVWIHGGGFIFGSASTYGAYGICDGLVRQGVVVVTIQYRLGPFGFFSTGDEVCRGNFGMWDQIFALKWIQDNIGKFHGDKDNVTIVGQSAGGASVDLLSLTPHANGLFHKMVPMAGNAFAAWSHHESNDKFCKEFAEKLGIQADDSTELLKKLKEAPADKMAVPLDLDKSVFEGTLEFGPVIDGELFPEPLKILREKSILRPIMTGVTQLEGGLFVTSDDILMKLVGLMLPEELQNRDGHVEEVAALYRAHAAVQQAENKEWRAVAEIIGDRMFNIPTLKLVRASVKRGVPTYFYKFNHYTPGCHGLLQDNKSPLRDASHCLELPFLFNSGIKADIQFCDHDKRVRDFMVRAFSNFAKFGNPNGDGSLETALRIDWVPATIDNPEQHVNISMNSSNSSQFFGGRVKRWIDIENKASAMEAFTLIIRD